MASAMLRPLVIRRVPPSAPSGGRVAERFIRVRAAQFDPEVLHLPPGAPARVTFRREGFGGWLDDAIVFPALGRLVTLPSNKDVVVEFDALGEGRYEFSCSRGTVRGALVVSAR